jgi:hypothetical protein
MRRALGALALAAALVMVGALLASPAGAVTLPDHRAYELVTRFEKEGHEADLNGVQGGYGYTSRDGNTLEWRAIGGCCGAPSAAQETYQSFRTANGWQTQSLMPVPNGGEEGGLLSLFTGGNPPEPLGWTPNMDRTIFQVPKAYPAGIIHPNGESDIYIREANGEFKLVSEGPLSTGEELTGSIFGGATPDANFVVFSSSEALTADATGLQPRSPEMQYLYLRNVTAGTTQLLDVDNSDALIGVEGAVLGNAAYLGGGLLHSTTYGTNTNAISADGSKVFFEAPLPEYGRVNLDSGESHLYMRDVADSTTTPLDEPGSAGWARYEGAAEDGSLVFFTSNEGLDGAPAVPELYVFNATGAAIGPVPSMSSIPISLGEAGVAPSPAGPVNGLSALANDGSRAWFVAEDVLAGNQNAAGDEAVAGQPNLYMYDVGSGATTYVATLGEQDISDCQPSCAAGHPAGLIGQPDLGRRAFPTPDGSALVFESTGNLTGEDGVLQTKLTAPVVAGEHTLQVESTAGLAAKQWILIGSGGAAEQEQIESIDSPTELTITEVDENYAYGLVGEFAAGEPVVRPTVEDYRFLADGALTCLSCVGAGTIPTGSATLGLTGGGTYGPPGQNVPMNEGATQIFFESGNALTPEAQPARPGHESESLNVYEWENGRVYLISDGTQSGSILDGTTPSGDDVFFSTRSQLTTGANGNWINVYDARVNGGFPEAGAGNAPCVGQGCRENSRATPFFEVPASSLGATEETEAGGGTFTVPPLSAAQRQRLARTGKLTLKVTATAPGTLTATMRAKLAGKETKVAGATTKLTKAGAAELDLVLSQAAREQLAAKKSLALQLDVTFSASDKAATARLTLHAPAAKGRVKHG